MKKKINNVLTLMDDRSYMRNQFFKLFAIDSINGIKFYYSMGEKSKKPFTGIFYKKLMEAYYKNVHTSAIKLPLADIEKVIEESDHISVGPCPCRILYSEDNNCEDPLFTCLKINSFSKFTAAVQKYAEKLNKEKGLKLGNEHSRVLKKNEAVEIIRNARKRDMVISLESCIQPYQNNICLCCTDCCIELNMRYKYGMNVSPKGPYTPIFDQSSCSGCDDCISRCPVDAIRQTGKGLTLSLDLNKCMGCGICSENCPSEAISLDEDPSSLPSLKKPGPFRLAYVFFLTFVMYIFFKLDKRSVKDENYKYFQAQPNKNDVVCGEPESASQ